MYPFVSLNGVDKIYLKCNPLKSFVDQFKEWIIHLIHLLHRQIQMIIIISKFNIYIYNIPIIYTNNICN